MLGWKCRKALLLLLLEGMGVGEGWQGEGWGGDVCVWGGWGGNNGKPVLHQP